MIRESGPGGSDGGGESARRRVLTSVLLAIGSELTTGDTADTDTRELAQSLAAVGVTVRRIEELPDDLALVADAFRRGLESADLVVSTGGLGPTPDDLTREAIAEVLGETPAVDPDLEAWLRNLFERRRVPYPEANLKQAWLVPSARAIPNAKGTAPGWWVERGGGIVVALPGPPSEMRAMWRDSVLPQLQERGLGQNVAGTVYRLSGIGESHVAATLGEALLRRRNPEVATYARADAVDVKISAHDEDGRTADELVADVAATVERKLGKHVWGRDDDTWRGVLGRDLGARGWDLGLVEVGTGGTLVALLGDAPFVTGASLIADRETALADLARTARGHGASIGLAVRADQSGADTIVDLAAAGPWGVVEDRRLAFLGGAEGRRRAALSAAMFLFELLRDGAAPGGAAAGEDSTHNQQQPREGAADPVRARAEHLGAEHVAADRAAGRIEAAEHAERPERAERRERAAEGS